MTHISTRTAPQVKIVTLQTSTPPNQACLQPGAGNNSSIKNEAVHVAHCLLAACKSQQEVRHPIASPQHSLLRLRLCKEGSCVLLSLPIFVSLHTCSQMPKISGTAGISRYFQGRHFARLIYRGRKSRRFSMAILSTRPSLKTRL